jgi:hypothetical protein
MTRHQRLKLTLRSQWRTLRRTRKRRPRDTMRAFQAASRWRLPVYPAPELEPAAPVLVAPREAARARMVAVRIRRWYEQADAPVQSALWAAGWTTT